jgi:hypothetical protein
MNFTNSKLTTEKLSIAKKPKSKATALRCYLKCHIGLTHNPATNALREEFALALEAVKGRNAPAIVTICRDCVGEGVDSNCRSLIRNCEITNCYLFNVRPYQSKSKVSPEYTPPRALLTGNANEVIERLTPANNSSKKRILPSIAINYFRLGE